MVFFSFTIVTPEVRGLNSHPLLLLFKEKKNLSSSRAEPHFGHQRQREELCETRKQFGATGPSRQSGKRYSCEGKGILAVGTQGIPQSHAAQQTPLLRRGAAENRGEVGFIQGLLGLEFSGVARLVAFCDLTLGFLLYRASLGHLSLEGLDRAVLVTEWSVGGVWWLSVL